MIVVFTSHSWLSELNLLCASNVHRLSELRDNYESLSSRYVHDTDKYEEYLDTTTQSYEISTINKLIADVTNSKVILTLSLSSNTVLLSKQ